MATEKTPLWGSPSLQETDTIDLVPEKTASPTRSRVVSTLILVLYIAAAVMAAPLMAQYIYFRKGQLYFNATNGSVSQSVPCQTDNTTSPQEKALRALVQKETTNLLLYLSLVSGIPSILANLVYGSYSDYLGRRKLFLLPLLGGSTKALIVVAVIHWNLDLNLLFLANALDGFTGSLGTVLLAAFAVSADVTSADQKRTVAIAFLDFFLNVGVAIILLVTGYLIEAVGYTWPAVLMLAILLLALLLMLLCLPETLREKGEKVWAISYHLRHVLGAYFFDGTTRRKAQFQLCILVFFFGLIGFMGRNSLESIYQISQPFCWDAKKISYFGATAAVTRAVGSTLAVLLLQRVMRDELVAMLGLLLAAASFVLEGLAVNDLQMYMVCVLGLAGLAAIPICRSLLSRMSPPERQGALFSSIAAVEAACSLSSSLVYNAVYAATVTIFKGAVFQVMAGSCTIAIICMLIFFCLTREETVIYEKCISPPDDHSSEENSLQR